MSKVKVILVTQNKHKLAEVTPLFEEFGRPFETTDLEKFEIQSDDVEKIVQTPLQNWKALLQDYSQKTFQEMPLYNVVEVLGPDHNKQFKVVVQIKNELLGQGSGSYKKEAEQQAAKEALTKLKPGNI